MYLSKLNGFDCKEDSLLTISNDNYEELENDEGLVATLIVGQNYIIIGHYVDTHSLMGSHYYEVRDENENKVKLKDTDSIHVS